MIIDIHRHFEMITAIKLINITISFWCVVRTLKIYYLTNIQVYSTLLLTTSTMLYIRSLELIQLTPGNLYP